MVNKIYDEYIEAPGSTSDYIKRVITNHYSVYNDVLIAVGNIQIEKLTFQDLKGITRRAINKISLIVNGPFEIIESVLFNEIHYLFKCLKRGKATPKRVDGLMYMTLRTSDLCDSYEEKLTVRLVGCSTPLILSKPLPSDRAPGAYFNLSYSDQTGRFKLAIFS